jgi:hypothetical protein
MSALTFASEPAVPAGRRLVRRAARFAFRAYTRDVLARRIADPPPEQPENLGLVLHRLESVADAAGKTPSLSRGEFEDLQLHLPLLHPLRRARWRRAVGERFRRGDVAYVATVDGDIAGWIWLSSRAVIRGAGTGLRIHLEPGDAYLYHFWTVPRHRHLGTARFVMGGALWDLYRAEREVDPRPDRSHPRVFGYIDRPNPANLLLLTVVFGFRVVETVRYVRLLYTVRVRVRWGRPLRAAPARPRAVPAPRSADGSG